MRRRGARRRHVRRGAGLLPSTERHSASQATAGSEQSGHAVAGGAARAAISWASSPRHRRRSCPCVCDQACGPPTLSVEKPLVGKVSAALPRDGRESPRRETGDHMPGRRCMGDCAGGAVLKKIAAHAACEGHRCGERQRRRPAAGPCSGWRRAVERARSKAEPSRQARPATSSTAGESPRCCSSLP